MDRRTYYRRWPVLPTLAGKTGLVSFGAAGLSDYMDCAFGVIEHNAADVHGRQPTVKSTWVRSGTGKEPARESLVTSPPGRRGVQRLTEADDCVLEVS